MTSVVETPPASAPAPARPTRWRSVAADALLYAALAIGPAVLSVVALHLVLGKGLGDYVPVRSDEVSYWHQIVTFSRVGFDNGYYTYQEQRAPMLSAYGFWGPMLPMVYGSAVAALGASTTVVVKLNLLVVTAAIGATLALARVTRGRAVLLGVVAAACTPLLFYLPSGMSEALHYAFAILFAGLFHRLLRAAPGKRLGPAAGLIGAIVVAALFRAPWALLLIPAALVALRGERQPKLRERRRRMLIGAGLATAAAAAFGLWFTLWSAPYPYDNLDGMRVAPTLGAKAALMVANLKLNLHTLFQFDGAPAQVFIIMRLQAAAASLLLLAILGWAWRRRDNDATALAGVATLALLLPLALLIGVYDLAAGTRVIGPHVFLVGALLALNARVGWRGALPVVMVASQVLSVGAFRDDVRDSSRADYVGVSAASIAAFRSELGGQLRYRPGVDRWCNTVLLSTDEPFFYQLAAIPPGFGVSVDLNHRFDAPLQSAYVLASDARRAELPNAGTALIPLVRTSKGTLYRNPGSPCHE